MGKLESSPAIFRHSDHYLPWHAHITALTVAPFARRLGLAKQLSASLEKVGDQYDAWFVDLFVRESNRLAIGMYDSIGLVAFFLTYIFLYFYFSSLCFLAAFTICMMLKMSLIQRPTRR